MHWCMRSPVQRWGTGCPVLRNSSVSSILSFHAVRSLTGPDCCAHSLPSDGLACSAQQMNTVPGSTNSTLHLACSMISQVLPSLRDVCVVSFSAITALCLSDSGYRRVHQRYRPSSRHSRTRTCFHCRQGRHRGYRFRVQPSVMSQLKVRDLFMRST